MRRREFLIGIILLAALPDTADARRFGRSRATGDSSKTTRLHYYFGLGIGGLAAASFGWKMIAALVAAFSQRNKAGVESAWVPPVSRTPPQPSIRPQSKVVRRSFGRLERQ